MSPQQLTQSAKPIELTAEQKELLEKQQQLDKDKLQQQAEQQPKSRQRK